MCTRLHTCAPVSTHVHQYTHIDNINLIVPRIEYYSFITCIVSSTDTHIEYYSFITCIVSSTDTHIEYDSFITCIVSSTDTHTRLKYEIRQHVLNIVMLQHYYYDLHYLYYLLCCYVILNV